MRLSRSFEVKNTPSLILIEKNQRIFQFEREEITRDTEQALQTFLRKSDPGLSLLAVKDDIKLYSTEIPGIEFGRKYGRNFSTPGSFLQGTRPETMEPGEIFISGRWSQDENHIATSDPEATVGFHCPTNSFSITAQSMSKPLEPAKVVIEINNESAYDMFALEDLTFDEESKSIIRAEGPRLYHALTSLPEDKREVTLRFPTANRATLALYSIRFFNSGPR
jgi:hypothetical protein